MGIDPVTVNRVIIDFRVGEIARITTHGYVESNDSRIKRLDKVLRRFELREIESEGGEKNG